MVGSVSLAALVWCVGAGNPAVPSKVDQRLAAAPGGRVVVDNPLGTVEVRGVEGNQVHVTGRIGQGTQRFIFEKQGDVTVVRVEIPDDSGLFNRVEGSHLVVTVPQGSELGVRVVSANATVSGMTGPTQVSSVGGAVRVTETDGPVGIHTVSGDVHVDGAPPKLDVDTVSGNVEVDLDDDAHALKINTVGGDVTVDALRVDQVVVRTVSGDTKLDLDPGSSDDSKVSSQSGDVVWKLSPVAAARFSANSMSGDIQLPGKAEKLARSHGPRQQRKSVVGNGFGGVDISTLSGNVAVTQQ